MSMRPPLFAWVMAAAAAGLTLQTDAAPASAPAAAGAPVAASAPNYSAAGLYNLANSYARDGKSGMAVLNYERARLLSPYDPDIESNLRFVRESAKLPTYSPNRFERVARSASPEVAAWAGFAGLVIIGGSLLAGQWNRRGSWLRYILMACGAGLLSLTLCNAWFVWPLLHSAVVITGASPVRVSPVPMGEPLFTLPEAETVRVTAEHDSFVLIRTRTGRTGWMDRANLAPVVPRT